MNNYQKILKAEIMFNIPEDDLYSTALIKHLLRHKQEIVNYLYQIDSNLTLSIALNDKN